MLSSASLNLESALFYIILIAFLASGFVYTLSVLIVHALQKKIKGGTVLSDLISYFRWCRNTADMPVCLYMAGISQLMQFGIS